jgi:hypothetical protein
MTAAPHPDLPPEILTELARSKARASANLDPVLEKFPAELKVLPNYVVWAFSLRQNRNNQWAVTKIPYQPLLNGVRREARSNDPRTWRTLAEAQHSLAEGKGFFDGIGFMLEGRPLPRVARPFFSPATKK